MSTALEMHWRVVIEVAGEVIILVIIVIDAHVVSTAVRTLSKGVLSLSDFGLVFSLFE